MHKGSNSRFRKSLPMVLLEALLTLIQFQKDGIMNQHHFITLNMIDLIL